MVIVRPRHVFAAALMASSLIAVSVPAAFADTPADPTGVTDALASVSPADTSTASPSPSVTPSATASPSPSASSSSSSGSGLGLGALPVALPIPLPTGGAAGIQQLVAALNGVTSQVPIPGLSSLSSCVGDELAKGPAADGATIEGCFSSFFETLTGAPQSTCLDPVIQGLISSLQDLLVQQKPDTLVAYLQDLPNKLQALPACLNPAPSESPTPTPTTTESSGGAATEAPTTTDAVPVVATPTFTG